MIRNIPLAAGQHISSCPDHQATALVKAHGDCIRGLNTFGINALGLGQISLPTASRDGALNEISPDSVNDIRDYIKLLVERSTRQDHRQTLLTLLLRYAKDLASAPRGQASNEVLAHLQDTIRQLQWELQVPAQASVQASSAAQDPPRQSRPPASAQARQTPSNPQRSSSTPEHRSTGNQPSEAAPRTRSVPVSQFEQAFGRQPFRLPDVGFPLESFLSIDDLLQRGANVNVLQYTRLIVEPAPEQATSSSRPGPAAAGPDSAQRQASQPGTAASQGPSPRYVSPWETMACEIEEKSGRGDDLGSYLMPDDLFKASTNPDPLNRKTDSDAKRRIAQNLGTAYGEMLFPNPEKGADAKGVAAFVEKVAEQPLDKRVSMLAALATGAPSVIGLTPGDANGEEVQKVYKVMEEHAPLVWQKVNELDLPLDRTGENGGISVLSLSPANQSVLPFAKRIGDILNSPAARNPLTTPSV